MAPRLLSVEEKSVLNTKETRAAVNVQLNDDLKLTLTQVAPKNLYGVKLSGRNFNVSYVHPTQDMNLEVKRGRVTLSQFVPKGNLYLVPNPTMEVTHSWLDGRRDLFKAKVDSLAHKATVSQTVYGGEDRRYKAALTLDSKMGPHLTTRAKLRKGLIHSVGAAISDPQGPVLSIKSRPFEGIKLKAVVRPQPERFEATVQYTPPGDNGHTVLTADLSTPFSGADPRLAMAIKWKF